MYKLSQRSLNALEGVHPDMVKVVKKAIEISKQDFLVTEGLRTTKRQQELYAQGRTTPGKIVTKADGVKNKSNHQAKADGYGHAVDLVPYPVDWNSERKFKDIANAMLLAASELKVRIEWGGNWKFTDLPHFELEQN